MEREVNIEIAKGIFKDNFIGPEEIKSIGNILPVKIPDEIPVIPFSEEELNQKAQDYLLVLCLPDLQNGKKLTILELRNLFGVDPKRFEPCFYNQDWYLKEDFVNVSFLKPEWVLLRKNVIESTRAKDPKELATQFTFPSALVCCYTFFIYKLVYNIVLWPYDFIWCYDTDHNSDRIYVAKYFDIDGVNKNGFSIHRHLSLRSCYASIDLY
jgi:hypothetical protein